MKQFVRYNRIWLPLAILLITILSLLSMKGFTVQALALEQDARCGIEEHLHTQDCQQDGKLVCSQRAHTHTENCYLILLKDNDINALLVEVDRQKDNNLETMIGQTVDNALMFNRNLTAPMETTLEASMDVAAINDTIKTYGIQPQVTLNENLYKSTEGYDGDLPAQQQATMQAGSDTVYGSEGSEAVLDVPPDPLSQPSDMGQLIPPNPLSQSAIMMAAPPDPLSASSLGASTYALNDGVNTGSRQANYYIYLDGRWVTVGNLKFTTNWVSLNYPIRYYASEPAGDIVTLYNQALGATLISTADLDFVWTEDVNNGPWTAAEIQNNNVYFGRQHTSDNNAKKAKYVRLMDGDDPLAFYTVTFDYLKGEDSSQYVRSGNTVLLPLNTMWEVGNTIYNGGTSLPITGTTTFKEVQAYTVTFQYVLQGEQTVTAYPGEEITLPTDVVWTLNGVPYKEKTFKVAGNTTFVESNENYVIVIFRYLSGKEEQAIIPRGEPVTPPEDVEWLLNGEPYAGQGIDTNVIFTEKERISIQYNVNFPTISGVSVSNKPTILGSTLTTLTDTVDMGMDARIRNVSSQEVIGKINNSSVGLSRAASFKGWQIDGTNIILSANATLTWPELQNYAGSDYAITLKGVWDTDPLKTASFYIRYDSMAVDTNGNMTSQDSSKYTPELYSAYVGGINLPGDTVASLNTSYYIADTSSDNSYGADQAVRALYGATEGIWLQSFPKDEYIFEQLKNYAQYLKVEGESVRAEDLNDQAYTIRWYVFKCQNDAWHVDGRLVKKEGRLEVSKTFAGNQDAISQAKNGFRIEARNETGDKLYYLYLQQPARPPQDGTVLLPSMEEDKYVWTITGVKYGEPWIVTETTGVVEGENLVAHSDYRVVDVYNIQNKSGTDTRVEVSGMTYSTDVKIQALRVEYTNIYHYSDSVIIKKEDYATGQPLSGAVFSLLQNGETLRFSYDAGTDRYRYNPEGDITELTGNGYYELLIEGFSYDDGPVEVREMIAPEGYTPVESVQVGYLPDGTIGLLTETDMARFDNGLLVVRNSTDSTSVTVTKQWLCPAEEWRPVTVQLLANGLPVNALVAGVEPNMELNANNGYMATWFDLPLYANGHEIQWGVRETRIGNEDCLSDFTFANWLVDYSNPTYTYDGEGRLANTSFTVTNDTKRTMLRLIKTNLGGGVRLEGATFTLERLIDGEVDPDFLVRTQTTSADGTLTFDNLKYGDYRLTEVQPPTDYIELEEAAYLTIHSDGTVEVQGHPYVLPGSTAFSVQVLNQPVRPLPLTGGEGTGGYIMPGLLLIAVAVLGYALPRKRKRGGADPSG